MSRKYLSINNDNESLQDKVHQKLKFRTGKFVWRVKFNTPLDPRTINNNNLYVMTTKKLLLPTKISYNSSTNEIEIEPTGAYSREDEYILHVSTRVRSAGGQYLKEPVQVRFKID